MNSIEITQTPQFSHPSVYFDRIALDTQYVQGKQNTYFRQLESQSSQFGFKLRGHLDI